MNQHSENVHNTIWTKRAIFWFYLWNRFWNVRCNWTTWAEHRTLFILSPSIDWRCTRAKVVLSLSVISHRKDATLENRFFFGWKNLLRYLTLYKCLGFALIYIKCRAEHWLELSPFSPSHPLDAIIFLAQGAVATLALSYILRTFLLFSFFFFLIHQKWNIKLLSAKYNFQSACLFYSLLINKWEMLDAKLYETPFT